MAASGVTKISQLAQVISCHAWNQDKSMVAICPNNNEIRIFRRESDGTFNREEPLTILDEHDQIITGLDWDHKNNRIVSCSQDRNAYVWEATASDAVWNPTLVILRINRAATQVKWSPQGDKFAVASGAKSVSVCYFEQDNNWWVSKHLRKNIESTVLSVDWHPNNILIACGGTDSKIFVVSGWVKGIDDRPAATPFGTRVPFGELLGEYYCGSWVHAVRWSPSGNQIAWVTHDSALTVLDVTGGAPGYIQENKLQGLPFMDLVWTTETTIIAVGHSCNPTLFTLGGDGTWSQTKEVDAAQAAATTSAGSRAAFNVFQNKTTIGQDSKSDTLNTKHQNAISQVSLLDAKHIATSGLDGKLIVWGL